jgi:hypothetical protein
MIGAQSLVVMREDGNIAWISPEHVVAIQEEPAVKEKS